MHTELSRRVRAFRHLPPPLARRAIRLLAGLSQQDMASALGVSRTALSRWESDKRQPRGDLLVRYAELLEELQQEGIADHVIDVVR